MEVIVAKTAGFCFGVERAVNTVMEIADKESKPVYTWGPVVHNEQVIQELSNKGVQVLNTEEDLSKVTEGTVIVRAHGISEAMEKRLRALPTQFVDATCPFVIKIHRIVEQHSLQGETILILGDAAHPEVQGIMGWCKGPFAVVRTEEDIQNLSISKENPITIVGQTTFHHKKFQILVEKIKDYGYNVVNIADTICNATLERQNEAERIASRVDLMLVIGSQTSSNSQKLYEICSGKCNRTRFIQNVKDLRPEWFLDVHTVGITAGASTPKKLLEEVQIYVRKF